MHSIAALKLGILWPALAIMTAGCVAGGVAMDTGALEAEVIATENAFAQTMARRDFPAFVSFLADEAIFISGPTPLRGKQAVAQAWKRYFDASDAPFAWKPERVVVLDSGRLALSTGPVTDPAGTPIGVFNSVWRREADGKWRIVFDKGGCPCEPPS